jgi:hypothetical protein
VEVVQGDISIQQQVTQLLDDLLPLDVNVPSETLCHYTSLSTTLSILKERDENVFLTECRYCNDREEFKYAFDEARSILNSWSNRAFARLVDADLISFKKEAYVFCLCLPPPDKLSQWRGYGADGRGACITFDADELRKMAAGSAAKRLIPIEYDRAKMTTELTDVIQRGDIAHTGAVTASRQATVVSGTALALYYLCPKYKDIGFEEEREWRFLYMPLMADSAHPKPSFRDRYGFVIPYMKMTDIATLPSYGPVPVDGLPVTEIMVGPSGLIDLNEEALKGFVTNHIATARIISITRSSIPYRPGA